MFRTTEANSAKRSSNILRIIRAADYCRNLELLETAFNQAMEIGVSDSDLIRRSYLSAVIQYISTMKNDQRIDIAVLAYDTSMQLGVADSRISDLMLKMACDTNDALLIKRIYNSAIERNIATVTTHTVMIKAMSRCNDIESIMTAYNNAVFSGMIDKVFCHTIMTLARNCGDLQLMSAAVDIYNFMIANGMTDELSHYIIMTLARQCQQVDLAKEVLQNAVAARVDNQPIDGATIREVYDSFVPAAVESKTETAAAPKRHVDIDTGHHKFKHYVWRKKEVSERKEELAAKSSTSVLKR